MTQIYANVRPESKYYPGQAQEKPFPVKLDPEIGSYHWSGGIGGQYRTTDLCFFVKIDGEFYPFDLSGYGTTQQLEVTKNAVLKGKDSDLCSRYWEEIVQFAEELLEAARAQYEVQQEKEREAEDRIRRAW